MNKPATLCALILVACSAHGPSAGSTSATSQQSETTIDPRKSVVVTDQVILTNFTFQRVLDQLASQSRATGLTSSQLFHQWWDTQNPGPGLGLGPHCDDVTDPATGNPLFNGYPSACRPVEGTQASADPFSNPDSNDAAYVTLGLFNRFDLAPQDGSHCGEYRIEFARRSGITNGANRNLVIFEGALPNPHPEQGLDACLPVVQFWAQLSSQTDAGQRAAALDQFYFTGLPGFEPVVHITHYGDNPNSFGQIRTNQFMDGITWQLREFKLLSSYDQNGNSVTQIVPTTTKVNPFASLFDLTKTLPASADFQQFLLDSVLALSVDDLNLFNYAYDPPAEFNSGISDMTGAAPNDYATPFAAAPATELRVQIEQILIDNHLSLSADNVVQRAEALSCAGCHELSGNAPLGGALTFPFSSGFVQVTEQFADSGPDGPRSFISQAMSATFVPHRQQIMEQFLDGQRQFAARATQPIGGRSVH